VEENGIAREVTDDDIIRYRRLACWRTSLQTGPQHYASSRLHCLPERPTMLHYMYNSYLV